MGNKIYYFVQSNGNIPVKNFLASLSKKQRAKIYKVFELIQQHGVAAIPNHIKKMQGTTMWEIRILGQDNFRIFYVCVTKQDILLLHAFNKKTEKTSNKEISIALKRQREWKDRNV